MEGSEWRMDFKRARTAEQLAAASAAGNIMTSSGDEELLSLSATTRESQEKHAQNLKALEAKHRARTVIVSTKDEEVKAALRAFGQPICLFGERQIDRRERLKLLIAEREVEAEISGQAFVLPQFPASFSSSSSPAAIARPKEERQTKAFSTEASDDLIVARQEVATFSWDRARKRLMHQWKTPLNPLSPNGPACKIEIAATLNERRPVSSCYYSTDNHVITGSFDECCRIYKASGDYSLVRTLKGHINRVCDAVFRPSESDPSSMVASGSAEGEIRIWQEDVNVSVLPGHVQRIGRLAWDPSGRWLASTSFDRTWRLWNVETSKCILIQDGHAREVYACAFHPDGALVSTTDMGAACLVWDTRCGKITHSFAGHVLGCLSANFSSNGYHLATGGLDNQVRVWDLRKKECAHVIPAHLRSIVRCKFSNDASKLFTASHDRSIKVWDARSWKKLGVITAHEAIISGMDVNGSNDIVSTGHDRVLKFFETKSVT